MKPKLYVMIGVSGSGKSTIAKDMGNKHNYRVISTDAIRKELFGSEEVQEKGDLVFQTAYLRIAQSLISGTSVIFDATNTTHRARKELKKKIKVDWNNVTLTAIVVETPLTIAIERNSKRDRVVPTEVIERQQKQLDKDKKKIREIFDNIIYI